MISDEFGTKAIKNNLLQVLMFSSDPQKSLAVVKDILTKNQREGKIFVTDDPEEMKDSWEIDGDISLIIICNAEMAATDESGVKKAISRVARLYCPPILLQAGVEPNEEDLTQFLRIFETEQQEAIIRAVLNSPSTYAHADLVRFLNVQGSIRMDRGYPNFALHLFLAAWRLSGNDEELRAECLIWIGNLCREFENVEFAKEIFSEAEKLEISQLLRGRIYLAQARVHTDNAIALLKKAIAMAKSVPKSDKSLDLWTDALYNLAEQAAKVGTLEEKREARQLIEEVLPCLDQKDVYLISGFNYFRAILLGEEDFLLAPGFVLNAPFGWKIMTGFHML